jgi:hypothetical protein
LANDEMIVRTERSEYKTRMAVGIGRFWPRKLFAKTSSINWPQAKYTGQLIRPWIAMKFQTQWWWTSMHASQTHSFDSLLSDARIAFRHPLTSNDVLEREEKTITSDAEQADDQH